MTLIYSILMQLAAVVALVSYLVLFIRSFKDGCLWPILIFFLPGLGMIAYIFVNCEGKRLFWYSLIYLPMVVSGIFYVLTTSH